MSQALNQFLLINYSSTVILGLLSTNVQQGRYLFVKFVSIGEAAKDIVTSLESGNGGANASMILFDTRNPSIFGEEELQECTIGFFLNKCRNFGQQPVPWATMSSLGPEQF